jgi:hypothetical protein
MVHVRLVTRNERLTAVAGSLLLVSAAILSTVNPVLASPCYPPRPAWVGSIFTGPANKGGEIFRARAEIEQYAPQIPTNTNGTDARVSAWVMLTNGDTRWAQMGWIKIQKANGANAGRWDWAQWTNGYGVVDEELFSLAALTGNFTRYTVQRDAAGPPGAGWNYQFIKGTTTKLTINLGSWTPNQAQWHGEINAYHNQMPGDTSNSVTFRLVEWYGLNGPWTDANTNGVKSAQGFQAGQQPDLSSFGSQKINSETYIIWDADC